MSIKEEKKEKQDKDRVLNIYENASAWFAPGVAVTGTRKEFLNFPSSKNEVMPRFLFNFDLEPWQHPMLRRFISIDPDNLTHREMLFESSPYLRTHTQDIVWELVKSGWKYVKKKDTYLKTSEEKDVSKQYDEETPSESVELIPQWDDSLKTMLIRAVSLALVVGCSFLVKDIDPQSGRIYYHMFTPNNVFRAFLNDNRRITEIYFEVPALEDSRCKSRNIEAQTAFKVGFLTQFSDVVASYIDPEISSSNFQDDKIFRRCVVIMPQFDILQPWGKSVLYNEMISAIQKMYVRFYEMLYLHKGGVDKNIVIPPARPDIKNTLLRTFGRGILNLGWVMEMDQDADLNASQGVKFDNVSLPNLPFDVVDAHINSDGQLSQQGISGSSEANNLSGTASIVSDINDNNVIKLYQSYLAQIIKDINDVFFSVNPNSYEIEFNKLPTDMIDKMSQKEKILQKSREMQTQQQDEKPKSQSFGQDVIMEKPIAQEMNAYEENGYDPLMQFFSLAETLNKFGYDDIKRLETQYPDYVDKHNVWVEQHSINDEYVEFIGNMFKAGTYKYPERNTDQYVTLTPADIRRYCEKDLAGRTGYLDIDHGTGFYENRVKEGIGYFITESYDEKNMCDVTKFNIRKDVWLNWGSPSRIKVSPRFVRRSLPNGGNDIGLLDCTVVINKTPRSELTGLKTEAELRKPNQDVKMEQNASTTCVICGRPLTTKESQQKGVGPVCETHQNKQNEQKQTKDDKKPKKEPKNVHEMFINKAESLNYEFDFQNRELQLDQNENLSQISIRGKTFEILPFDKSEIEEMLESNEDLYIRGVYIKKELENFYESRSIEPYNQIMFYAERMFEEYEGDPNDPEEFKEFAEEYMRNDGYNYDFDSEKAIFVANGVNATRDFKEIEHSVADCNYIVVFSGYNKGRNFWDDGDIVYPTKISAIYYVGGDIMLYINDKEKKAFVNAFEEENAVHAYCRVCGRPLTNLESARIGIGPTCAKNVRRNKKTTFKHYKGIIYPNYTEILDLHDMYEMFQFLNDQDPEKHKKEEYKEIDLKPVSKQDIPAVMYSPLVEAVKSVETAKDLNETDKKEIRNDINSQIDHGTRLLVSISVDEFKEKLESTGEKLITAETSEDMKKEIENLQKDFENVGFKEIPEAKHQKYKIVEISNQEKAKIKGFNPEKGGVVFELSEPIVSTMISGPNTKDYHIEKIAFQPWPDQTKPNRFYATTYSKEFGWKQTENMWLDSTFKNKNAPNWMQNEIPEILDELKKGSKEKQQKLTKLKEGLKEKLIKFGQEFYEINKLKTADTNSEKYKEFRTKILQKQEELNKLMNEIRSVSSDPYISDVIGKMKLDIKAGFESNNKKMIENIEQYIRLIK